MYVLLGTTKLCINLLVEKYKYKLHGNVLTMYRSREEDLCLVIVPLYRQIVLCRVLHRIQIKCHVYRTDFNRKLKQSKISY
jgi:hypothetical protein